MGAAEDWDLVRFVFEGHGQRVVEPKLREFTGTSRCAAERLETLT